MRNLFRGYGMHLREVTTNVIHRFVGIIKSIVKFVKANPVQTLAPIGVLICSVIMMTTDRSIPILVGIQSVLLFFQFRGTYLTVKNTNISRAKEDKERLLLFFEPGAGRMLGGSVRFLSIYKNQWPQAWYYRLRGITRLSLYRWGTTDHIGSYTKFKVNTKELFHLQLKGCIDTEDADKAVEGIDFIAKGYLTK